VLFLLARTCHAPRLFLRIGDRLAFTNGAIALSVAAGVIYAAFGGVTESLIPLYAVGVFLAFTLSQAGMVVHWWRRRTEAHRRKRVVVNGVGASLAAIVFVAAAVTKFSEGAWVAVLAIGLVIGLALRIRHHYDLVAEATALQPHSLGALRRPLGPATGDGSTTYSRAGHTEDRETEEATPRPSAFATTGTSGRSPAAFDRGRTAPRGRLADDQLHLVPAPSARRSHTHRASPRDRRPPLVASRLAQPDRATDTQIATRAAKGNRHDGAVHLPGRRALPSTRR
jgi:hypothetical protein